MVSVAGQFRLVSTRTTPNPIRDPRDADLAWLPGELNSLQRHLESSRRSITGPDVGVPSIVPLELARRQRDAIMEFTR
jgi:hypothetical protein